jgi:hypothetical protein
MRLSPLSRAAALWGLAVLAVAPAAEAQAPPPYPPPPPVAVPPPASPEASEIAACLCLNQSVGALSADMSAKRQAYDAARERLTRLDQELEQARAGIDVNNPQSVAEFRQLLERRDGAFRRSTGPVAAAVDSAVSAYNQSINEYNARCANRPRDPRLLAEVQATLSCPAPYSAPPPR